MSDVTPEQIKAMKSLIGTIVKVVVGVVLFFILIFNWPFGTVNAGERGIRLRFGAVVGEVGEGLYARIPIVEQIVKINVQINKEETEASAASKDLQVVTSKVALNYHLESGSVGRVYQTVGIDYKNRVVSPALQESVKAATAKFTAEELVTRRPEVREMIRTLLVQKLQGSGILVDDFNIVDFDFSKSFNDAIEAKVTAEQNALAARNKLEQVKYEAQQVVESAKGKAEAQRIEGQALRDNPQVVELRAVEKWNGSMPTYWGGGALPFVNVAK